MRRHSFVLFAAAFLSLTSSAAVAAPGDAVKCLATKIKIVGKYEACRYKAEALAVSKALPSVDSSKCEDKYTADWAKAELKYGLDCPTNGDASTIHATATGHVNDVVATLKNQAPVCGNNNQEGSEVCDGTDLAGASCVSQGYDDGTLACSMDCGSFDVSACANHDCSLLDQTGCGVGQACYPVGLSEVCAGEGSATEGQGCMFVNSCVGGMTCVNYGTGNVCAPFCDNIDNVPGCQSGQTCENVPEWDTNVGFCHF